LITNSALYNVMINAIQLSSRLLKRDFGEIEYLQSSIKNSTLFVQKAEERTKKLITSELLKSRPDFGFIDKNENQEVKINSSSERNWIIQPIDGKINFSRGLPYFSTSITLMENNSIFAGLIYNSANDDIFYAEKGIGATFNNKRIRVSSRKKLEESIIILDVNKETSSSKKFASIEKNIIHKRQIGSTCLDLAYVASGRFDGFLSFHYDLLKYASGLILIKEAGGFLSDFEGNEPFSKNSGLIAGNPEIHKILKESL